MVVYTYNPSARETEQKNHKFQACLGYLGKLSQKQQQTQQNQKPKQTDNPKAKAQKQNKDNTQINFLFEVADDHVFTVKGKLQTYLAGEYHGQVGSFPKAELIVPFQVC